MDPNANPKKYRPNKLSRAVSGNSPLDSTADFEGQYPTDLEDLFSKGGDSPRPSQVAVSLDDLIKGAGGSGEGG